MQKLIIIFPVVILIACNSQNGAPEAKNDMGRIDSSVVQKYLGDSSKAANGSFRKYCNGRYNYCIEYPSLLIVEQKDSDNGDGAVFKNLKGEDVLIVFGISNLDNEANIVSLKQLYDDDLYNDSTNDHNGRVITYDKMGKDFYQLSGLLNGKTFFKKIIVKPEGYACMILKYDEMEKEEFDKVSEHILQSFE